MNKFLCIAVAILSASSLARAEDFYVGANVSPWTNGHVKFTDNGVTTEHDASRKANLAGLFAGYVFSPNWALEAGYHGTLGSTNFDVAPGYQLKARNSAAYLAARGTWQLNEDWSLFAKAGAAQGRLALDFSGKDAPAGATTHKTGAYLSVGASWLVTKDIAVQLELEHTDKLKHEGLNANMDRFALGMRFGF
jgi:OOP family OmpA-OmpF porin